jgi:hypothetical protein
MFTKGSNGVRNDQKMMAWTKRVGYPGLPSQKVIKYSNRSEASIFDVCRPVPHEGPDQQKQTSSTWPAVSGYTRVEPSPPQIDENHINEANRLKKGIYRLVTNC